LATAQGKGDVGKATKNREVENALAMTSVKNDSNHILSRDYRRKRMISSKTRHVIYAVPIGIMLSAFVTSPAIAAGALADGQLGRRRQLSWPVSDNYLGR
jgi:hypothetical protein